MQLLLLLQQYGGRILVGQIRFIREIVKTMEGQRHGLIHMKHEKHKKSVQRINLPGLTLILLEDQTRVVVIMRTAFSMIIMDATILGLRSEGLGLNIVK
jgi:hypothetical protein